ncbi:MAG TPA: AMP-binding protein [Trebonia sp.]|nr:AMP-binding protein [Trebonia sp.]
MDASHNVIRAWIDEAAARHGDDVYLADARSSASITYAGLLDVVRDTERCLDDAGLPRGARIQVRFASPLDYAVAMVSIVAARRVAVPLDPGAPDADIARVLSVARPAGTITSRRAIGAETAAGDGEATHVFGISVLDLDPLTTGADGGIFLCTSGTTGTPKGILLRDEQLAHVASTVVDWHKLTKDDRGYCSLPLFHVNAEVVGVLATLRAGAYLAVDSKFSRRGFWERMTERQITWINAVPAIISILAMDPPAEPPAGLRFVRSASAPLPLAALERFEMGLGVPVIETYGMTEAASMITANPLDGPRKPGSAGLPAASQVRIAVPGGGTAGAGDIGRVTIRGAGTITAYASGGRPGAIDADGWLDTGDLGYLDDEGYLFLVGRSDDVINRGGEKIYPREIEEILLAQPGVRSAAVIGAVDEVLGERPVAYVVPHGDAVAAEIEALLREVCAERLPRHKQPSEFWLVDEMPLGPTGKISRRLLKEAVASRP